MNHKNSDRDDKNTESTTLKPQAVFSLSLFFLLPSDCGVLGSIISRGMELDEDTDLAQLFAEPNLTAVEKAQLMARSEYEYHR